MLRVELIAPFDSLLSTFPGIRCHEHRRTCPSVCLRTRSHLNRVVAKDTTPEGDKVVRRLFDEVRNAPARGTCTVEVGRLSARVKASKQAPKNKRPARLAETTLRYEPVALPCPQAAPVELWMVHAREERPPAKTEPLEWFVLTTMPVTSADDATRILQWYALRWRIEDYFRILKSGCKVEELQHHSAERLERAIAIKMVIAWRIQLMVRLGREVPELPSELLFSDGELRVLATFARSRELPPPERLGEAVGLVARLGGWLSGAPAPRPAHSSCGTATPSGSAGVVAAARMEEGKERNTGSPAGGAARANRTPARGRPGRSGWRRGL